VPPVDAHGEALIRVGLDVGECNSERPVDGVFVDVGRGAVALVDLAQLLRRLRHRAATGGDNEQESERLPHEFPDLSASATPVVRAGG
jgi:hypothetical protein